MTHTSDADNKTKAAQALINKTVFLTVAGSHAYGTNTPESDLDIAGVFVPPVRSYLSLETVTPQHEDKVVNAAALWLLDVKVLEPEVDGTIFELHKFLRLAAESNPNILDILFASEDSFLLIRPAWEKHILPMRNQMLSRKVYWTFRGYAKNQLDRMERHRKWLLDPPAKHPERKDFGLPEGGRAVPTNQLEAIRSLVQDVLDRWEVKFSDEMPRADVLQVQDAMRNIVTEIVGAEPGLYNRAVDSLGLEDNFVEIVKREHVYDRAVSHWNSYQAWKKGRNPKRSALEAKCGYDAKHASHCIRLLKQTAVICRTNNYRPKNPDIIEELLEIRAGNVPYDALRQRIADTELEAAKAFDSTTLPAAPDWNAINNAAVNVLLS